MCLQFAHFFLVNLSIIMSVRIKGNLIGVTFDPFAITFDLSYKDYYFSLILLCL